MGEKVVVKLSSQCQCSEVALAPFAGIEPQVWTTLSRQLVLRRLVNFFHADAFQVVYGEGYKPCSVKTVLAQHGHSADQFLGANNEGSVPIFCHSTTSFIGPERASRACPHVVDTNHYSSNFHLGIRDVHSVSYFSREQERSVTPKISWKARHLQYGPRELYKQWKSDFKIA